MVVAAAEKEEMIHERGRAGLYSGSATSWRASTMVSWAVLPCHVPGSRTSAATLVVTALHGPAGDRRTADLVDISSPCTTGSLPLRPCSRPCCLATPLYTSTSRAKTLGRSIFGTWNQEIPDIAGHALHKICRAQKMPLAKYSANEPCYEQNVVSIAVMSAQACGVELIAGYTERLVVLEYLGPSYSVRMRGQRR